MYLIYDEYIGMGGEASEASFSRLEHKARTMIDLMTYGRIASEDPARQTVKYACFELIQAMTREEESAGIGAAEVSSVSNDGVSISYTAGQNVQSRCKQIIRSWLAGETTADGTPLLYAGVRVV